MCVQFLQAIYTVSSQIYSRNFLLVGQIYKNIILYFMHKNSQNILLQYL